MAPRSRRVDVDRAPAPCFGLADELADLDSGWHAHARHQLLYAARGAMQLQVRDAHWLLPPGRAAWIPARTQHRVTASTLRLRTVYLHPRRVRGAPRQAAVFGVTPLAREMIAFAMQLGPRHASSPTTRAFFGALAALAVQWSATATATAWWLPVARTPELARVMQWTLDHVDTSPRVGQAARACGLSTRTLARRFAEETSTTWRRYLHDARMLEAMRRLARPGTRVSDVGHALGFGSAAAFCHAFTAFAGETPRAFVRRAAAGEGP